MGGQPGHDGNSLKAVAHPDNIDVHADKHCRHCQASMELVEVSDIKKWQVFDLPKLRVEVTEHLADINRFLICGAESRASFPEGMTQSVQYGP